jgi:hypothetical protein
MTKVSQKNDDKSVEPDETSMQKEESQQWEGPE